VKQQAAAKDGELMDPVVKKVNSFLDLWGKQHGYDLIFGTMSGGNVLQANPAFNVTAAVLKDLNAQYKSVPKP
jgi:outer membrane protein